MLRHHLPEAEILTLTHPAGSAVMRGLCSVEEVTPEHSWRELGSRLRAFGPEAVLCCCEKRRAALATWASGAPIRVGFAPTWSQPLKKLASQVFFSHLVSGRDLHETQRYGQLVEAALGLANLEVPSIQLQPLAQHYASVEAREFRLGMQLTPKWCRFGYTVQHLRQWVAALPEKPLGLVGPAEEAWARAHFPDLTLYCSRDLFEYAAVLESLKVFVTIDTGAAHVAAARKVPTVDVFPAENSDFCVPRWRPWQCPHEVVLQPPDAADQVATALGEAVGRLWNAAG
jgi:ADP-heptose:LPS heptosyltransferase